MNRIVRIFADLHAAKQKALMPFVTAGYPSLAVTAEVLPALQEAGASVCELGFPFSDPIADGPVIQASMTEALAAGADPCGIFEMVARLRPRLDMGLVAMVSYSIVYRMGVKPFVKRAAQAGFDGFIFPDLPLEEAEAVAGPVKDAGMVGSLLIAPTTPDDRAAKIAKACSGFIYMLARTGITGEQSSLPAGLEQRVAKLRQVTDLPLAVGFGISSADHVRSVTRVADAAIVGSALVRQIGQHKKESPREIAGHVKKFTQGLAGGLN